ncbi:MAG: hypothetical protein KF823_14920 [Xanthomonadales bacterium]|nr:hypothetical protein [Xanthomonadales bacterium]
MSFGTALISLFVALLYGIVTTIAWRRARIRQPGRAIFAITVLPLFVVAMLANIALVLRFAPWLTTAVDQAARSGSRELEAAAGLLAATPLACLLAWAWYRFLAWLSGES